MNRIVEIDLENERVVVEAGVVNLDVTLAVQGQGRSRAQVVEHRRRLVEEERQVVLDTGAGNASRDILVNAGFGRVAVEGQLRHVGAAAPQRASLRRRRRARSRSC